MIKIQNVVSIIVLLLLSFTVVFSDTHETPEEFDPSIYEDESNPDRSSASGNFDPSVYEENANQEESDEGTSNTYIDTKDSQKVIVSEGIPERIVPLAIYGSVIILLIIALLLYSIHYYRKKRHNSSSDSQQNYQQ